MTTAERIGADIRKNIPHSAILADLHDAAIPEVLVSLINGIATSRIANLTELIRPGSKAYEIEKMHAVRKIEDLLAKETIKQLKAHYKL